MNSARRLAAYLVLTMILAGQAACAQPAPTPVAGGIPTATATPPPVPAATPAPTNTPRQTALPSPAPVDESETVPIPTPDPTTTRLLRELWSVVPEGFTAVQYLDAQAVRVSPGLQSIESLEVPRFLATLPPGTLSLIDHLMAAVSNGTQDFLLSIQGPIDVEALLEVATSYGNPQQEVRRESYKGYSIALVDLSGIVVAGSAVTESISVIAVGSSDNATSGTSGIRAAIDAYDATAPRMSDGPHFAKLLESLPSGVTASLTDDCNLTSPLAGDGESLTCEATAFSIGLESVNTFRVSGAAVFQDEADAAEALVKLQASLVVGGKEIKDVDAHLEGNLLLFSFLMEAGELAEILGDFQGFQIGPVR